MLADPGAQGGGAFGAKELAVHGEHVRPFVGPMLNEIGVANQFVDEDFAFLTYWPGIGEKSLNVFGFGWQAGEVEVHAAEELFVATEAGGCDFEALPFFGDEFIDFGPGLRLLPDEAGAVAHDGDGGGGVGALEAGKHRGFAAAQGGDEAAFVDFHDFDVAAIQESFGGDIFHQAIGITGDDTHLLAGPDDLDDGIFWEDFDAGDARGIQLQFCTLADPGFESFIVQLTWNAELTALMRHTAAGFEQHHRMGG